MAPLVVIVGPTASGKSNLAVTLAEQFGGEIICADSRTVYKHMDIGTAKPSAEDQARVPHWGLDLVEPNEPFSVAKFQEYANEKIADIRLRGKIPFLVGGTGLYIDAVIFEYEFGPVDNSLRDKLELLSLEELHRYCIENNINLPENEKNRRYVIRAIEQKSINTKRLLEPQHNTIIVGITTNREILHERIHERSEHIFESGVVEEAKSLGEKYGWKSEAMTGNIYRLAHDYLNGTITKDEFKQLFETADRQLAKRQLTWLKRNSFIKWLELDYAQKYIARRLVETA
ncbi:MAG: putative tRNA dimethylallyltransferase [Candidatus Saccharibacteria bacterium]|nr:putative tRNA dimethylallyltransferase [Candidatus Saccharibacteria bacterium]